jgi:hypothetical protein
MLTTTKPTWSELFAMVLRAHRYVDEGCNMTLQELGDLRSDIDRLTDYLSELRELSTRQK